MGFSVTATHAIFLIAILGAGSFATTLYWSSQEQVDESRRVQAQRIEERAHTNLTVLSSTYDGVTQKYTVQIRNNGAATLRIGELHYLVDGAVTTNVVSTQSAGVATTDLWLPGETLVVTLGSIATTPTYFQLVTGDGASVSHTV